MNIETKDFTREQLLAALFSNKRKVRYEYVVNDMHDGFLGKLEIKGASISYDSTVQIKRTFRGTVKKSELMNIDCIDYRLTPWMCLLMPGGKEAKWPLGKFIIDPSGSIENGLDMVNIVGYDLGKIASDDKVVSRYYLPEGGVYTSHVQNLIGDDYPVLNIESSEKTKYFDQEWEIGTPKITIVNDIFSAISYTDLYFNEYGEPTAKPYVDPMERDIELEYISGKNSIIVDGIKFDSNNFDIPNKFVRYIENADARYLIATYTNDSDASPYSVQNRGRTIVDSEAIQDIATQGDLNAYVRKIAAKALQSTETIEFSTLNMPWHGYQDCLWVDILEHDIRGKFVEKAWEMDLTTGGTMRHVVERVVEL